MKNFINDIEHFFTKKKFKKSQLMLIAGCAIVAGAAMPGVLGFMLCFKGGWMIGGLIGSGRDEDTLF